MRMLRGLGAAAIIAVVALVGLVACGDDGYTGPSRAIVLGPFPDDLSGKVAFVTYASFTKSGRAYTEYSVHVVDIAHPVDNVVYTVRDTWIEGITWAPDGEHLVVQTAEEQPPPANMLRRLHLLGLDGSDQIVFDGDGPEYHPSYGADGRLAYFAGWGLDPTSGIFIDGVSVRHVTCTDNNSNLSWSPDGEALVFTCSGGGLLRLVLSTGAVTQVFAPVNNEALTEPAYSRDGTRIALMRFGGDWPDQEIWTIAADGSDARRLTAGASDGQPQWTPDGNYLAFGRSGGGMPGIYLIPPEGGKPGRIIGMPTFLGLMAWSW